MLFKRIKGGYAVCDLDNTYVVNQAARSVKGEMSDFFVEAHRGPYKGRWRREGLYELLFDHQYRACEISIQIARGCDWASRVVFKSQDTKTIQNIRTDIANGAIIKSADLSQVDVRMAGLDQLIADWNRNLDDARRIANAYEVVTGENLPSNTPFALGQLMDQNSSKLFVYLRQKLGTAYSRVFRDFSLPVLVRDLTMRDIIRVTGDEAVVDRFKKLIVDDWYLNNLIAIGPHAPEVAASIKAQKLLDISDAEPLIRNVRELWKDILKRLQVTVTGENYETAENLQTIASVLQFETDPVRRAFLLDTIYSAKGIPVPPVMPQQPAEAAGTQANQPSSANSAPQSVPA